MVGKFIYSYEGKPSVDFLFNMFLIFPSFPLNIYFSSSVTVTVNNVIITLIMC